MPDERRAIEQDLFNRAALVWRIERRTKIGLSHREPKTVLEGSTRGDNREEEIGEDSSHYHERYARQQSPSIAAPADVRGSSRETAGTKRRRRYWGRPRPSLHKDNTPTKTHEGEAEGLLIGVSWTLFHPPFRRIRSGRHHGFTSASDEWAIPRLRLRSPHPTRATARDRV